MTTVIEPTIDPEKADMVLRGVPDVLWNLAKIMHVNENGNPMCPRCGCWLTSRNERCPGCRAKILRSHP